MINRKLLFGVGVALSITASACNTDKLTEANKNPNDPEDAPSGALFTNSVRVAAARWLDGVGGTRYGFLPQHLAEVQYPDDDTYQSARLGAVATTGLFDASYSTELQDLKVVMDRGKAATEPGLWAPAAIISSWEFGVLTDVFGPIPFTEALKPGVTSPSYDAQKVVYDSLFVRLNSASDALGSASNFLGTGGDPIYGGDPASWRKFANSLRLRHAMRLTNVAAEASRVSAEVAAAVATSEGGLIDDNSENAKLVWPGDGVYDNPWANNFKGRDDHRISDRFLTIMSQWQDPRLGVLAMSITPADTVHTAFVKNYCPTTTTCFSGLANALTQAQASPLVPNTSRPGVIFYPGVTSYGTFGGPGKSYPSYYFTAAETYFLLAEAAQRGIGGLTAGQAANYYNLGITRNMELLGIGATQIAAYLAQPGVAYVAGANGSNGLIQIATQKWIALYTDPIQAWAEVRRTCQPAIVQPGPAARFDIIPRRLQYSNTDRSVNRAKYNEGVAQLSPASDVMTARFYWDNSAGWSSSPTYVAGCSDRRS
jgi:SusD/RagB-like outer membrane lipoprotein